MGFVSIAAKVIALKFDVLGPISRRRKIQIFLLSNNLTLS